jgi:hypothetical protein
MNYYSDRLLEAPGEVEQTGFMTPYLVRRLETALGSVGAFGEVRLVVLKGRVRFIEIVRSESLGRRAGGEEADA